jgi:hypothetical protein
MIENFWRHGILPYTAAPRNTTLYWDATDTEENLNKNPNRQEWMNIDIPYVYNSTGFRTYNLDLYRDKKVNIALGCSHTLGVGIAESMRWSNLIEQATGIPMLNFGVGGGTTDTVARIMTNVVSLFSVQTAYIFWPEASRFEKYYPNRPEIIPIINIVSKSASIEDVWYMSKSESANRFFKNQAIVYMLSKIYNFSINELDSNTFFSQYGMLDLARDGSHPGPKTHQKIAEYFLTQR